MNNRKISETIVEKRKKKRNEFVWIQICFFLPIQTDGDVRQNIGSDWNMWYSLNAWAHEITEWPRYLSDHVVTIERNVDQSVQYIGIRQIDKKIIRGCSHTTVSKNNPNDHTITEKCQDRDNGK